jgi:hypothetical protein
MHGGKIPTSNGRCRGNGDGGLNALADQVGWQFWDGAFVDFRDVDLQTVLFDSEVVELNIDVGALGFKLRLVFRVIGCLGVKWLMPSMEQI